MIDRLLEHLSLVGLVLTVICACVLFIGAPQQQAMLRDPTVAGIAFGVVSSTILALKR